MRLFNNNEHYSVLAGEIDTEVSAFLRGIIEKHPNLSTRELEYLFIGSAVDTCTEQRILKQVKHSKELRNEKRTTNSNPVD